MSEYAWFNDALDYKDVFLVPQYSECSSRSEIDTSITISKNLTLSVPVISANMDTVTEHKLATSMRRGGGIGALHRFMSIERNIQEFKLTPSEVFVSIGVNEESKLRAQKLLEAGATHFIIDIAHGHSKLMKDMVAWLRSEGGAGIFIMAGNVATQHAIGDLASWDVDAIKIGIGPGNVCLTKNVTGVTVPQFSAVKACAEARKCLVDAPRRPLLVADGGIAEIGDIAKALAAGADLVMCGRLFAASQEAPGERINGKKVYRGMASKDAMLTIRSQSSLPTAEGASTLIDASAISAEEICAQIKGGLQSAFSYSNSRTLQEFQDKAQWATRK